MYDVDLIYKCIKDNSGTQLLMPGLVHVQLSELKIRNLLAIPHPVSDVGKDSFLPLSSQKRQASLIKCLQVPAVSLPLLRRAQHISCLASPR